MSRCVNAETRLVYTIVLKGLRKCGIVESRRMPCIESNKNKCKKRWCAEQHRDIKIGKLTNAMSLGTNQIVNVLVIKYKRRYKLLKGVAVESLRLS